MSKSLEVICSGCQILQCLKSLQQVLTHSSKNTKQNTSKYKTKPTDFDTETAG